MINEIPLNGWWQIKFDENDQGEGLGWAARIPPDCRPINVPSCWNEVFAEYFSYEGAAWYYKVVYLRPEDVCERNVLVFEGVSYRCAVFLNGQPVGTHEGGFTRFSFDITQALAAGVPNLLAVKVDSRLDGWTLPPAGVDWFNYAGIYRRVVIETSGAAFIDDTTIRTRLNGDVSVAVCLKNGGAGGAYRLGAVIEDTLGQVVAAQEMALRLPEESAQEVRLDLHIEQPQLWRLGAGYLYSLRLALWEGEARLCDRQQQHFGIRELRVDGQKILINGEAVKLVGCSKHDEYPLTGRTVSREQLIKDYDLLRQMSANFVRLAHYPHNRLEHAVLDELGMATISEIPLVFLGEAQMTDPGMLAKSKHMLAEMIRAEKNNPCILFWSLFIECETHLPSTRGFVQALVEYTRGLDDSRLIIMASNHPLTDTAYEFFDVIGMNYWEGWYGGASVEKGVEWLEAMARHYPEKPLLITSHGWEGLPGMRSYVEKVPWSEDLQADYLSRIAEAYMGFKNIVGEIVWTFADFRVSNWRDISEAEHAPAYLQRPAGFNHKGMVDFTRRPKSTYYVMKEKFAQWQELTAPALARYGQNLAVRLFSNRRTCGQAAAFDFIERVQTLLAQQETVSIVFGAAASQEIFLQSVLQNRHLIDWRRVNAYHLDEFVGAEAETCFGRAHWLKSRLIEPLPLRRFEALNGRAGDLAAECERYAGLLGEAALDLACIGIGENGQMGFNHAPAADFNDPAMVKRVDLDPAGREQQLREGVFSDLAQAPRQALSLTIPAILRAAAIQCVVTGASQRVAVWKTLHGEIGADCPATSLRGHPQVSLYLDGEAAGLALPGLNAAAAASR